MCLRWKWKHQRGRLEVVWMYCTFSEEPGVTHSCFGQRTMTTESSLSTLNPVCTTTCMSVLLSLPFFFFLSEMSEWRSLIICWSLLEFSRKKKGQNKPRQNKFSLLIGFFFFSVAAQNFYFTFNHLLILNTVKRCFSFYYSSSLSDFNLYSNCLLKKVWFG